MAPALASPLARESPPPHESCSTTARTGGGEQIKEEEEEEGFIQNSRRKWWWRVIQSISRGKSNSLSRGADAGQPSGVGEIPLPTRTAPLRRELHPYLVALLLISCSVDVPRSPAPFELTNEGKRVWERVVVYSSKARKDAAQRRRRADPLKRRQGCPLISCM